MNYQDDIPLARRIKSIKTITTKSFLRIGLLLLGLGISVTLLADKSFLSQRKSLDDSSNSIETRQNKSLLGHLPYKEASKKDLILFSPGIYVHKDIYEKFKEMQFMAAQRGVSLQLLSGYRSINDLKLFMGQSPKDVADLCPLSPRVNGYPSICAGKAF